MSQLLVMIVFSVLVIVCLIQRTNCYKNNVCSDFMGYTTDMDRNKNCWYDPEMYMSAEQILVNRGYKFEEFNVTTKDGYILLVYRLPQPPNIKIKGVLLLEPPMISSCVGYIDKKNESFAFMAWHAGYEVWLGNFRGTSYGRKHVSLDPDKDIAFWDFTFHKIGIYDMSATLEFVADISGRKDISMIGYSMGATAGLIYAAMLPDHAREFTKSIVLWAPTSNMKHTRALTKQISSLETIIELWGGQGMRDLAPHNKFTFDILGFCRGGRLYFICLALDLIFFGDNRAELKPEWFPFKYSHNPQGIPYHCISHYFQLARTGVFKEFDYGPEKNLEMYNSTTPPRYPVERIKSPVVLVYGGLDLEAPEIDVLAMYNSFQPAAQKYGVVKVDNLLHGGFFYAASAPTVLYKPQIEFFDKIYSENKDSNDNIGDNQVETSYKDTND